MIAISPSSPPHSPPREVICSPPMTAKIKAPGSRLLHIEVKPRPVDQSKYDTITPASPSCRRKSIIEEHPAEWKLDASPHSPLFQRRKSQMSGNSTPLRLNSVSPKYPPAAARASSSEDQEECDSPATSQDDKYVKQSNASKPVEFLVKAKLGLKQSYSELKMLDPEVSKSKEETYPQPKNDKVESPVTNKETMVPNISEWRS